jgi:hypothetical protein
MKNDKSTPEGRPIRALGHDPGHGGVARAISGCRSRPRALRVQQPPAPPRTLILATTRCVQNRELACRSECGDGRPDRDRPKAKRQEHYHDQRPQPDQPRMEGRLPQRSHPRPIVSALQQNSAVHHLLPAKSLKSAKRNLAGNAAFGNVKKVFCPSGWVAATIRSRAPVWSGTPNPSPFHKRTVKQVIAPSDARPPTHAANLHASGH